RTTLFRCCGVVLLVSSLAIPLVLHSVFIWPALVLFGASAGGLYTLSLILVGQRFRDDALVRANAHIALLWGFGCLLGPFSTGAASRWLSSHALPLLMAGMAAVFLLLALRRGAFEAVVVRDQGVQRACATPVASAPLILHTQPRQPAAPRCRLVVAVAGAVDDQRADVIPVGQVLQSGEGLQGEIAQLVPIAGAPVHDAVARGAVQVVISGVTPAHALGFDGGMKARPGRLPEQLGVGAVAGNAG